MRRHMSLLMHTKFNLRLFPDTIAEFFSCEDN